MATVDLKTGTGAVGDTTDLDTGAGTDDHGVVAVGLPAPGGHVVGGTPTNPLRVDPTGTTAQPVSDGGGSLTVDGPLTDTELRASAVPVSAAALPLPAGAATEVSLAALLTAFGLEDFSSETTLNSLLTAFNAEDFATQTTLATRASEATLATRASEATLATRATAAAQTDGTQKAIARSGAKGAAVAADITSDPVDANTEALHIALATWLGSTAPTIGQKAMADSLPVAMASDQTPLAVTTGAAAGTQTVASLLLNVASEDMVVDGSGVPVVFSFDADPVDDIQLTALRLVLSSNQIDFDGNSFGNGSALTTGISIDIVANNGTFTTQLALVQSNEDFLRLLDFSVARVGNTDALAASLPFGSNVQLVGGTADNISVTIQDDLTAGPLGVDYLTGTLYGNTL
jgi:hypothetical protein